MKDLRVGDVVYVRMTVWAAREENDYVSCHVRNEESGVYRSLPVPRSQVIFREPSSDDEGAGLVCGDPASEIRLNVVHLNEKST